MNKLKEMLFKGGVKKEEGPSSFVLELKLHCDGCVHRIKKILRKFDGVEDVIADLSSDTLTVIGKADPYEVRDKLEDKARRKVVLHSMQDNLDDKVKKKVVVSQENILYDVFLSFRGKDTRTSFISHFYDSLQKAGIKVFKDDDSLQIGNQISKSLLQAIEGSRISVVVFSRNYADSSWCLNELVKIMECHRTMGKKVVPVFYDVDPSDVRNQKGLFGKAFQNLLNKISKKDDESLLEEEEEEGESLSYEGEEEDELRLSELSWRKALRGAASIAGFALLNSRNESKAIKDITEEITHLLDKT